MSLYLLVLWPFFGALAVFWVPRANKLEKRAPSVRETFVIICTAAEVLLISFLMTEDITKVLSSVGGVGMSFQFGSLGALCCLAASMVWLLSALTSRQFNKDTAQDSGVYHMCSLLTLSAVVGFFLSADFFTLLIFYIYLSASVSLAVYGGSGGSEEARRAARGYIYAASAGTAFMLVGMLILYNQIGSLSFYAVGTFSPYTNPDMLFASGIFMFAGFAVPSGLYPLHSALRGLYREAPAPAAAFILSSVSRCGLYGILIISIDMLRGNIAWSRFLMAAGAVSMLWGAVCALLASDVKKVLAASLLSQSGITVLGTGAFAAADTVASAAGASLQLFNGSLIFFALSGVVSVITADAGSSALFSLRGRGRDRTGLGSVFLSALLGLCGIPLWNGYLSLSIINETVGKIGGNFYLALFMLCGGLTIAYSIKLYFVLFAGLPAFGADLRSPRKKNPMEPPAFAALAICAVIMLAIGAAPYFLAKDIMSFSVRRFSLTGDLPTSYFTGEMLLGAFIPLIIGTAVYAVFMRGRETRDYLPEGFDIGRFFASALRTAAFFGVFVCRILDCASDTAIYAVKEGLGGLKFINKNKPDAKIAGGEHPAGTGVKSAAAAAGKIKIDAVFVVICALFTAVFAFLIIGRLFS